MAEHKFKIGELVQLTRTAMIDAACGRYEIAARSPSFAHFDGEPRSEHGQVTA
jgi:hypothetical protein